MPVVNPEILLWARETAGLTLEAAASKIGINDSRGIAGSERLAALEQGAQTPSRPTLVNMAKHYRRPLLTFYLSAPPRTGDRGEDFRTLSDSVEISEAALVDAALRDIRARQALMRSALIDEEEDEPLAFIGSMKMEDGVAGLVHSITEALAFSLRDYQRQSSIDHAFGYLRARTETAGVFVLLVDNLGSHHTTIPVEAFRGFALADEIAPFIAINANDSRGAWCFTLVHELAHLWLGLTGVSGNVAEVRVERFCNDVASEFLLPVDELATLRFEPHSDLDDRKKAISAFAAARRVSSTMVAYKLYRSGRFSLGVFEQLQALFRADFRDYRERERQKNRGRSGGPAYHILRKHRLGSSLVRLVGRMTRSGTLTTTKAGKVLGVHAKNVQGVLDTSRPQGIV